MVTLIKAIILVAMLGVPLLVIIALPRLFELAGSVPALSTGAGAPPPTPVFTLVDATPTAAKSRFAPVEQTPPPTLAPAAQPPAAVPTARPSATGERILIGNTGGVGAVLRSEPVTGSPLASLRDGLVLDVLERRNLPGSGDWVRVRTAEGAEGWVTGRAALPVAAPNR